MPEELKELQRTKLHRPRVSYDLIIRKRLLNKLDEGLQRWLTLVCGPVGFGKTSLISSWADRLSSQPDPLPVVWLSLDTKDSDVTRFAQYLIGAICSIFDGACSNTLQLLKGRYPPPLNLLSITLSNEIEQIPRRFVLVLDDYHSLKGEQVHDLLNDLLQHWPSPLHLVIISRSNPPLPLPRLRANGQLTEIRSNEMRFERGDISAFVSSALKTSLSEHAVEILLNKTEGWAGALRLATLSLRSTTIVNDRILSMAGTDGDIAEYLAKEVMAQQLPVIQNFLKMTSVVDSFCVPLCEAIIGDSDPAWNVRACIEWLESQELFIVSLDDQHYWHRYHQLFLDYLRDRALIELGPIQVANLHRRAAIWYEEQGMTDLALHYSLESGDLELVAQIIAGDLPEILNRDDRPALERCLRLLPEDFVEQHPELLIIKAWVYQFAWQLEPQQKVVQQVEALLETKQATLLLDGSVQILKGQIAALKAQYAYLKNQPHLALAYSEEALALVPEHWVYLRGGIMFYLGLSLRSLGETQKAESLLLEAYEGLSDKSNTYALRLLHSLCIIYLNNGDLERVYQTARVLLSLAEASGLIIHQGWAHFFLGNVLYQWNDFEVASKHFEQIIKHRYSMHVLNIRDGITGQALIHQISLKREEAWQLMDLLSQIDLESLGAEVNRTRSLRARLQLMGGDLEAATRWADGYQELPSNQPLTWMETPHLTLIQILLARNLPADIHRAHQILDQLMDIAERTFNTRYKIEVLTLRAMALDAEDQSTEALKTLEKALMLARPGGFIRVFVDLGPSMLKMMKGLVVPDQLTSTLNKIIAAFPEPSLSGRTENVAPDSASVTSKHSAYVFERLTTREREILYYMSDPISLKEIAVKLSVSYATVKRHTINIYGKLGVNSRWEAVAKATKLNLLPAR